MDHRQKLAAAHILGRYQEAGRRFDGIHQMLLTHLRENRQADPKPREYARLVAEISRLGFGDYLDPATPRPNLVIDGGVLISFARLDDETVGAALIDAVADSSCQVLVSPLAYARVAGELRHREWGEIPAVVDVPPLTFPQVDLITRLDTGERLDVMHTVLLALRYRCVIGTFEPEVYHRVGYGRVLNLGA